MLQDERRERQEKLGTIIYQLAKEMLNGVEDEYKTYLDCMKEIYEGGFRHTYSEFFPIVSKILKEKNEYNIDYLANNLNLINTYLEAMHLVEDNPYDSNMYIQVTKLCDHLNLQISQLSYLTSTAKKTEDASERLSEVEKKLEQTYKKIDEANERLEKSQSDLENMSKELEKSRADLVDANVTLERSSSDLEEANERARTMQTELVTILSIFAAIVITFSGGLTLLGSAVTSIVDARHYESVVLIAIICGMVIFNTIFLMMYLVSKLIKREIFAACDQESCKDCHNSKCRNNKVSIIKKRLPYVYYYNFISIVGIGIDLFIWILDMHGCIG